MKNLASHNVPVILLCLCVMHLTFGVLPVVLFVKLASMSYFVAFFFSFILPVIEAKKETEKRN